MPLITPVQAPAKVQFAVSESLDILNAMYFTFLVEEYEGIDGWPQTTRRQMRKDLLDELNLLHTFPRGEPGIMGALQELLFLRPEAWGSVKSLVEFVRSLDTEGTSMEERPGVQLLVHYAMRFPCNWTSTGGKSTTSREELARELFSAGAEDPSGKLTSTLDGAEALALFDDPQELRERIARLIEDFDREHYRADAERRMRLLQRDVEARRPTLGDEPVAIARAVMRRDRVGLEEMLDRFTRFVFVPSLDVGVYHNSTTDIDVFGLYYAASPEPGVGEEDDTERLARLYKALADPQRLKILSLLAGGELYAQEVVDKTGLHQSVVSRHLSFLKGVGLLNVRRQNNMKFFSLNADKRDELKRAVDAILPAGRQQRDV